MVCNIGDFVEFLSDNVLRSSLHRVTPYPAEAGTVKLIVVYFMRSETDAVFFVDREGKQWKSVDWRNMKQRLFAKDWGAQKTNLGLTGRLGHNDLTSLLGVICYLEIYCLSLVSTLHIHVSYSTRCTSLLS